MPQNPPDFYSILGVFRDATQEEIKRAYLHSAQRLHPDKNTAAGETELFLTIQQAYEVLSNPNRRKQYDLTLPSEAFTEKHKYIRYAVQYSRPSLVYLQEKQILYALVKIEPSERQSGSLPAPPLNICLVLDRSTSMQGEKMNILKDTAVQLMRSLRAHDVLSIVTFSDRAEVVVPASINTDIKKHADSIQKITPSGATEIFQGLNAGLNEIRKTISPDRVNHIILLTDGNTYGDEQKCLALAEKAALMNVGITGMGIGYEWNDIFLDALAGKTGGSSVHISQPRDIEHFLIEKFKSFSNIYADEVNLEIRLRDGVETNFVFRLQPDGGQVDVASPLRLGPILRNAPLEILIEMIVHPQALHNGPVTLLEGALKVSVKSDPMPVAPLLIRLNREVKDEPAASEPPKSILKAISQLTLYRMQERAKVAAEEGRYNEASQQLQRLATHLLAQGENSAAKTALLEAQNLENSHAWSASGIKDIKYQTRALLLGGGKEKN